LTASGTQACSTTKKSKVQRSQERTTSLFHNTSASNMGGESARGRSSLSRSGSLRRSRSKSRDRRNSKPLGARLKGMMKGIRKSTRKIDKSSSRTDLESGHSGQIQIEKEQFEASAVPKEVPTPKKETADTAKKEETKSFRSLQLVLLLMDPESRRFELLQLEFDSEKARVADIIAQIPVSVTEQAIRGQKYEYVLDESTTMRQPETRLLDFCDGRQVLVAVPKGTSVKECVRLARPILCDPQVVKMLNLSGFNVNKWDKNTKGAEETKTSRSLPSDSEPAATSTTRGAPMEAAPVKPVVKKQQGGKVFAPIIPVVALLVIILQTYHNIVTQPVQVGIPLGPGTFRSKCGLLAYSPFSDCENSSLEVHDDGTVAVFNEVNELDMMLIGGICTVDECVDGILLEEDGRVYVGGRIVKSAARFDDESPLSPWPFAITPKLKANPFNKVNAAASNI